MNEITNILPALQLIVALLFWEISKYAIRLFMGKTIGADNISRAECEQTKEKLQRKLETIKELLLVVAMKSGVGADELKKLTK